MRKCIRRPRLVSRDDELGSPLSEERALGGIAAAAAKRFRGK
jgi:hypothetical protein